LKRYLSSPFFLIALICFFLPFFAVTCSGFGGFPGAEEAETATTVTGLELVTGKAEDTLGDPSEFQSGLEDLLPSPGPSVAPTPDAGIPQGGAIDLGMTQIWAIVAAAVALLGIFLSIMAGRAGALMALILGAAGAILLFVLQSEFKSSIVEAAGGAQVESFLEVQKKIGFLLALGAFILAAILGLIRLLLPDRPAGAMAGAGGFQQPPGTAPPPTAPAPPPPAEAPPA
jgi:hypothetical protein